MLLYMFVNVRTGTVVPAQQQQWLNDALSSHTLNYLRELGQLSEDLARLYVDICLQEMKSPCGFAARSGHYRLLCLLSLARHYGLAFTVATYSEERSVRYWPLCHRVAVIQLHLTSALVNDNTVLRFLLACIYNI